MQSIWMDADPGVDDALAMATALGCFDIQAMSTVAGNIAGDHTFRNAVKIFQRLGRPHIPVYQGSDEPLFVPLFEAKDVHGGDGLAGLGGDESIPLPQNPQPGWVDFATSMFHAKGTSLVATGPLTNVAKMFMALPHLLGSVTDISIMGGAYQDGNVTPTAEFNFYVDPHAAEWVLAHAENRRIRLLGLDVARKTRMAIDTFTPLTDYGEAGLFLYQLLTPYAKATTKGLNSPALVLYDVLAVAALYAPTLFQWEERPVTVAMEGPMRGTMIEMNAKANRAPVLVAHDIDVLAFYQWFWSAIGRALA